MSRDRNREEGCPVTMHGVGLTRGEREGLLKRAGRGGSGAAKTRRASLLLAVDRGGFADLRTADAEAARSAARRPGWPTTPRGGRSGRVRRRARAQGAQRAGKRQDRRRGRDVAVGVGRPVPRGGGSSWSGTTRACAPWGRPARRSRQGRPSGWPPASRPVTHPGTFRVS